VWEDANATRKEKNRMTLEDLRKAAQSIVETGIRAVDPRELVRSKLSLQGDHLSIGEERFDLTTLGRIVVIGAGKAGAPMAHAVEEVLGKRISNGFIIVKDGHGESLEVTEVVEAGHPLPDERGVDASRRMLSLVSDNAQADTLILCLISGGGSALMALPHDGISLSAKQETTRLLLECGASIDEINAIRKHISQIKGGRLARAAAPAQLVALLLSDVIGDRLDVIASGPTVGDPSTFSDAKGVLEKYDIWERTPESVRTVLEAGIKGEEPETPKPGDAVFRNVSNIIVGSNRSAVQAASAAASSGGFSCIVLSTCISGEAREAGRFLASVALESRASGNPLAPPACIIAGGETTVTIRGHGKGGRNQELALSAALALADANNIVVASVGTDGTDGPTDAAGAIVDTTTVARALAAGLDPLDYLNRNDSYNLLEPLGDLLITGPTGTNVMDLMLCLVG
jgi:hydroxypyruvate reductase